MRALLAVVIALGAGLALAEQSAACSLAASPTPVDPRARVADADAAFVGTLLDIRAKNPPAMSSAGPFVFTFRVEERIKGDLPDQIEVVAASGASCGLDGPVGRRMGLILTGAPGAWTSWLGDMFPPEHPARGLGAAARAHRDRSGGIPRRRSFRRRANRAAGRERPSSAVRRRPRRRHGTLPLSRRRGRRRARAPRRSRLPRNSTPGHARAGARAPACPLGLRRPCRLQEPVGLRRARWSPLRRHREA